MTIRRAYSLLLFLAGLALGGQTLALGTIPAWAALPAGLCANGEKVPQGHHDADCALCPVCVSVSLVAPLPVPVAVITVAVPLAPAIPRSRTQPGCPAVRHAWDSWPRGPPVAV